MDMIPFHARPGLSNAFPPEKPCIAGRLPPVCTTWTISDKSRLPALPYDEKPGPSCKEAGLIFFFPSAGSLAAQKPGGALSAALNSGHPADNTQEGAGHGQSSACPLLPEETAPQEQPSGNTRKGYAYSALPKNSFRASTT